MALLLARHHRLCVLPSCDSGAAVTFPGPLKSRAATSGAPCAVKRGGQEMEKHTLSAGEALLLEALRKAGPGGRGGQPWAPPPGSRLTLLLQDEFRTWSRVRVCSLWAPGSSPLGFPQLPESRRPLCQAGRPEDWDCEEGFLSGPPCREQAEVSEGGGGGGGTPPPVPPTEGTQGPSSPPGPLFRPAQRALPLAGGVSVLPAAHCPGPRGALLGPAHRPWGWPSRQHPGLPVSGGGRLSQAEVPLSAAGAHGGPGRGWGEPAPCPAHWF